MSGRSPEPEKKSANVANSSQEAKQQLGIYEAELASRIREEAAALNAYREQAKLIRDNIAAPHDIVKEWADTLAQFLSALIQAEKNRRLAEKEVSAYQQQTGLESNITRTELYENTKQDLAVQEIKLQANQQDFKEANNAYLKADSNVEDQKKMLENPEGIDRQIEAEWKQSLEEFLIPDLEKAKAKRDSAEVAMNAQQNLVEKKKNRVEIALLGRGEKVIHGRKGEPSVILSDEAKKFIQNKRENVDVDKITDKEVIKKLNKDVSEYNAIPNFVAMADVKKHRENQLLEVIDAQPGASKDSSITPPSPKK